MGSSLDRVLTSAPMGAKTATVAVISHERSKRNAMCWNTVPDVRCIWPIARNSHPLYHRTGLLEAESLSNNFLDSQREWRKTMLSFGRLQASEKRERTAMRVSEAGNC
jgi:hypothetical protein